MGSLKKTFECDISIVDESLYNMTWLLTMQDRLTDYIVGSTVLWQAEAYEWCLRQMLRMLSCWHRDVGVEFSFINSSIEAKVEITNIFFKLFALHCKSSVVTWCNVLYSGHTLIPFSVKEKQTDRWSLMTVTLELFWFTVNKYHLRVCLAFLKDLWTGQPL